MTCREIECTAVYGIELPQIVAVSDDHGPILCQPLRPQVIRRREVGVIVLLVIEGRCHLAREAPCRSRLDVIDIPGRVVHLIPQEIVAIGRGHHPGIEFLGHSASTAVLGVDKIDIGVVIVFPLRVYIIRCTVLRQGPFAVALVHQRDVIPSLGGQRNKVVRAVEADNSRIGVFPVALQLHLLLRLYLLITPVPNVHLCGLGSKDCGVTWREERSHTNKDTPSGTRELRCTVLVECPSLRQMMVISLWNDLFSPMPVIPKQGAMLIARRRRVGGREKDELVAVYAELRTPVPCFLL